ncbi:MAG: O-antigen ligase family protein [Acidobacteriia bacterium]|nr:O-antigen ligase family protein [Terriglobia bacterium]
MTTLCGAALLVPLLSALTSAAVPVELRILLAAFWALAIVRPHWAIAALTVTAPFSSWLLIATDTTRLRLAETLVLAALSGLAIAAGRPRRTPLGGQRPGLVVPGAVFTAIVLASIAVSLRVLQTGTHAPWPFLRDFLMFLTRDYLLEPPGASYTGVADGALLLEGVALAWLVARHARDGVLRPVHLLAATTLAAAGAALLTIRAVVAHSASLHQLLASRTSVHVTDVNAAGSYFAMAGLIALTLAVNTRWSRMPRWPSWPRVAWGVITALLLAGVWLTGSRVALVSAIGACVIVAFAISPLRPARWPAWATAAVAIAVAVALAVLALGIDPRPTAARTAANMISMRRDFMITGLRMIRSAPVFGVGVGRYYERSGQFMPQSIYWFYFHENAHNNFLQIGGELGLIGVAAFVWLLGAAAIRLARGVRADPRDVLLLGAVAGVATFVATWMTSHPLLVAEVAYPFWILLGVALARADGDAQPPLAARPHAAGRASAGVAAWIARPAAIAVAAIAAALVVSVPLRARHEIANLDLTRQTFGFYPWEADSGVQFRWTARRGTFFVPLNAHALHLTLRAIHLGTNTGPTEVTIAIGGRTLDRVLLHRDDWVPVSLRLPLLPEDDGYQRIDLITSPTWSPAAMPGEPKADVRILGVQVTNPVTGP